MKPSVSKRPRYHEEAEEGDSNNGSDNEVVVLTHPGEDGDVVRVAQLLKQTEALLDHMERRKPISRGLTEQHRGQRERLVRIALQNWFLHNFSGQKKHELRFVTRGKLMGFCNAYLDSIGLPILSKQDPLWNDWFLKECVGLTDRECRVGKPVQICDGRTLEAFASSLEGLLTDVRTQINGQSPHSIYL